MYYPFLASINLMLQHLLYVCLAHLVLDNPIMCLSHLTLASCLPHQSSLLRKNPPPRCMLFKYKVTNPEPTLWTISFKRLSYSLSTCHKYPRTGTKQLGGAHIHQSLLKLFKWANPKLAYPASPVPYCGNHNNCSCQSSSWSTACFPVGIMYGMHPPLGNRNKLSLQRQSSPEHLALLYLKFSINALYFKIGGWYIYFYEGMDFFLILIFLLKYSWFMILH